MTDPFEALARLAGRASGDAVEGPHLTPEELEAVRASGDDDARASEDEYRHLASCPACRARLSEPTAQELLERAEAHLVRDSAQASAVPRATTASATPVRPRRQPGRGRWFAGLALAAGVLLTWVLTKEHGHEPRATLLQRSYVGVMGDSPSPGTTIAAGDENLELALQGESLEAARVLIADSDGRVVVPWRTLRPGPSGLHEVFAPRTFKPHRGALHALVVYGNEAAVAEAVTRFNPGNESGSTALNRLRSTLESSAGAAGAHALIEQLRLP